MLRSRVLTAAVLAPLFALGVLALSQFWFAFLLGLFVALGAWEWTYLSGYDEPSLKAFGAAAAGMLMAAVYFSPAGLTEPLLLLTCCGWLAVAVLLFHRRNKGLLTWPRPLRWVSGVWVLIPAWLAIVVLQHLQAEAVLMLFVLIWAADIGAYFAGRRWGHRKLAPAISPGKTVAGLWGGFGAAAVVAAAFGAWWGLSAGRCAGLVVWSVAVVLMSVFGDLFESNWKRMAELKDSGGVLPGHGGILDRIDSITAAAPFFVLGWLWWFGYEAA